MPIVFWNERLSVKINSIDNQHKKLIEMLNDFYDNMVNRSNIENTSGLIKEMKEYVLAHFALEEKYMEQFNYDYYLPHKKEHEFFIAKVAEVEEKINKGEIVFSLDMISFLKDWLKNHIMVTDMKYSEFFIDKGLK